MFEVQFEIPLCNLNNSLHLVEKFKFKFFFIFDIDKK